MTFPTYEEWGEKIAEQVIDVYTINGRTIREWIEILSDELTMLDKIREEIESLPNANPSYWHTCDVVEREEVLEIIDKYRNEVSE
jgi:hypothetical protein